jgi:uncharacterized membrane protein YgcG
MTWFLLWLTLFIFAIALLAGASERSQVKQDESCKEVKFDGSKMNIQTRRENLKKNAHTNISGVPKSKTSYSKHDDVLGNDSDNGNNNVSYSSYDSGSCSGSDGGGGYGGGGGD